MGLFYRAIDEPQSNSSTKRPVSVVNRKYTKRFAVKEFDQWRDTTCLILEDGELKAIEISIVQRPFVLDFAGAKLPHEVPDFDEEIMAEHHEHLRELFGERWTDALHVAEMFRLATGYTLLDIHPGNIAFADEPG